MNIHSIELNESIPPIICPQQLCQWCYSIQHPFKDLFFLFSSTPYKLHTLSATRTTHLGYILNTLTHYRFHKPPSRQSRQVTFRPLSQHSKEECWIRHCHSMIMEMFSSKSNTFGFFHLSHCMPPATHQENKGGLENKPPIPLADKDPRPSLWKPFGSRRLGSAHRLSINIAN